MTQFFNYMKHASILYHRKARSTAIFSKATEVYPLEFYFKATTSGYLPFHAGHGSHCIGV